MQALHIPDRMHYETTVRGGCEIKKWDRTLRAVLASQLTENALIFGTNAELHKDMHAQDSEG